MSEKPAYEELEKQIQELEAKVLSIKGSDESLKNSYKNFQALLNNSSDYILISDDKGSPVTFNVSYAKEIYRALGIEMKPGLKPHTLLKDKKMVDYWNQLHQRALNGEKLTIEYSHKFDRGEIKHYEVNFTPIIEDDIIRGFTEISRDITKRKQTEKELQAVKDELECRVEERTRQLEVKTNSLEEINMAMNVLLKKREEDKKEIQDNVLTNLKELIVPNFEKIKKTKLDDQQKTLLSIIESNLNEIISPFTRKMALKYLNLTPTEIQIANLIKQGSPSKQIAELMNVSPRTIDTHRKNIRRKIGLQGQRRNLRSYLLTLH